MLLFHDRGGALSTLKKKFHSSPPPPRGGPWQPIAGAGSGGKASKKNRRLRRQPGKGAGGGLVYIKKLYSPPPTPPEGGRGSRPLKRGMIPTDKVFFAVLPLVIGEFFIFAECVLLSLRGLAKNFLRAFLSKSKAKMKSECFIFVPTKVQYFDISSISSSSGKPSVWYLYETFKTFTATKRALTTSFKREVLFSEKYKTKNTL